MGIPAFYRWLVERYPRMVADVVEATHTADASLPNPNGVEFDNLYLDMNCIVHPCFHPEGLPAPSSYEEVFVAVFKYIDKISIVRPRKLLYMAINGVAPRAKMNQHRSRRFRAAKEATDEERQGTGLGLQDGLEQPMKLDSNVITPGTEFMDLLSSALRYYVHLRMNENLGWRGIKVILSDASVPGEGEHKIMSYIHLQGNLPGFDPNTRHCLYGLDADLIMLALSTHEIHFTILRENISKAGLHDNTLKNGKYCNSRVQKRKSGDSEVDVANNLEDHILRLKFQINLARVEQFVQVLGTYESAILRKRNQTQKEREKQFRSFAKRKCSIAPSHNYNTMSGSDGSSLMPGTACLSQDAQNIRLGEEGWNERFYAEKFEAKTEEERERIQRHAVLKYVEGICWVMQYYYEGVCSWQWFYPYHYAPFASDFLCFSLSQKFISLLGNLSSDLIN